MPPARIEVELIPSQANDFYQFLLHHKKIDSFQKIKDCFLIRLINQSQEEYSAFLQSLREIFQIKNLKEIKLCQAKCRDGTLCLNETKQGDHCCKHNHV